MSDPGPVLSDKETIALKAEYMNLFFSGGPQARPRLQEIDRTLAASAQARDQEVAYEGWQMLVWMMRKVRRETRENDDG